MTRSPLQLAPASQAGVLRFIRYGLMPNRLGYCGPDRNQLLFDHATAGHADASLVPWLTRFLGPMPYLHAIAAGNGIADPFDDRVVEAYWIGSPLLERSDAGALHEALAGRFKGQVSGRVLRLIVDKVPAGARAHHSFHVLDVWRHVGRLDGDVLAQIDSCRVSWGTVVEVSGARVTVERRPLVLHEGRLSLGTGERSEALRLIDGRGYLDDLAAGERVSLHWGWVCEPIDERQSRDLERYTLHSLRLANQTL